MTDPSWWEYFVTPAVLGGVLLLFVWGIDQIFKNKGGPPDGMA